MVEYGGIYSYYPLLMVTMISQFSELIKDVNSPLLLINKYFTLKSLIESDANFAKQVAATIILRAATLMHFREDTLFTAIYRGCSYSEHTIMEDWKLDQHTADANATLETIPEKLPASGVIEFQKGNKCVALAANSQTGWNIIDTRWRSLDFVRNYYRDLIILIQAKKCKSKNN